MSKRLTSIEAADLYPFRAHAVVNWRRPYRSAPNTIVCPDCGDSGPASLSLTRRSWVDDHVVHRITPCGKTVAAITPKARHEATCSTCINGRALAEVAVRRIAADWHGGQWTALYSIASTGRLHDGNYRRRAIAEIDECLKAEPRHTYVHERRRLRLLLAWVSSQAFASDLDPSDATDGADLDERAGAGMRETDDGTGAPS